MPTNESLQERLARYQVETMRAVAPPGPAAVRRTVLRRQRRRVALAGVAALVAIASAIGVARWLPTRVTPVNPEPVGVGLQPPGVVAHHVGVLVTLVLAVVVTVAPDHRRPRLGPVADLHVSGPSSVTLASDGTVYRGQFNLTINNSGIPYTQTTVYLALPVGVDIDFQAGDPGFGTCVRPPSPETFACYASSIPSRRPDRRRCMSSPSTRPARPSSSSWASSCGTSPTAPTRPRPTITVALQIVLPAT